MPMRRLLLLLSLLLMAAPARAQEWRMAPEYDVLLTSFEIQPRVIRLKAGEPVRLRFVNNSEQRHRFSAPDFFRRAQLRRRDGRLVRGGTISVAPLSEETIVVVPKAGAYKVAGDNVFRRVLGMSARIVVK
jgi:uncharacterized cupredoxin-like copper-binding protein